MRGQFFGYVWAAQQMGFPVNMTIVRGIAILKTKYNTLEVYNTQYPQYMLDRWEYNMKQKVKLFVSMYKAFEEQLRHNPGITPEEFWPMSFGEACNSHGGPSLPCAYRHLCILPNPALWYDTYGDREWNPLTR